MAKLKTRLLIFLVCVILAGYGGIAAASGPFVPKSGNSPHVDIPVFTPESPYVLTVAGVGDVDVSSYSLLMPDTDIEVYWGSASTNHWTWAAYVPLGFVNAATIHVDGAVNFLVMSK